MKMHKTHELPADEWITPHEASQMLPSVSRRTVQSWAKNGKLPNSLQLPNGHWRVSRKDVEAILAGGSVAGS